MYVRRSQLAGAAAAPNIIYATPAAAVPQGTPQAVAAAGPYSPSPTARYGSYTQYTPPPTQSQITAQRAAAARAGLPPPPPPKATSISFYDEARRTLAQEVRSENGLVNQGPDLYDAGDAEEFALPDSAAAAPGESSAITSGDAITTAETAAPETGGNGAALIPLAIAAFFLLGG